MAWIIPRILDRKYYFPHTIHSELKHRMSWEVIAMKNK
jgi:hypothetical protein